MMQTRKFLFYILIFLSAVSTTILAKEDIGQDVTKYSGSEKIVGISSISITVADLDRSLAFYTKVLPFKKVSEREVVGANYEKLYGVFGMRARIATLELGEERIELIDYLAPEGLPMPIDTRGNDEWFQHIAIPVSDMEKAYRHLRKHNVQHASTGPQTLPDWNPNAGGIKAFYFRDPDGNFLEVLWFPEGKGNPRWQKAAGLFMGIDHSAIVVGNTDEALRFYRDTLGMKVAGGSLNYGTEQEHLANVEGARVRITSLSGDFGPGIEFLEYLFPNGGRPIPKTTKGNDLMHWHITAQVKGLDALTHKVETFHGKADSIKPVVVESNENYDRAMMVRGPNGHSLILAE